MLIKIGTHWVNVVNATAVNRVRLQKVEKMLKCYTLRSYLLHNKARIMFILQWQFLLIVTVELSHRKVSLVT